MNVKYNDFIRTTQPRHHKCAQELWKRCAASGDIYLDTYIGWYLEREEVTSAVPTHSTTTMARGSRPVAT